MATSNSRSFMQCHRICCVSLRACSHLLRHCNFVHTAVAFLIMVFSSTLCDHVRPCATFVIHFDLVRVQPCATSRNLVRPCDVVRPCATLCNLASCATLCDLVRPWHCWTRLCYVWDSFRQNLKGSRYCTSLTEMRHHFGGHYARGSCSITCRGRMSHVACRGRMSWSHVVAIPWSPLIYRCADSLVKNVLFDGLVGCKYQNRNPRHKSL